MSKLFESLLTKQQVFLLAKYIGYNPNNSRDKVVQLLDNDRFNVGGQENSSYLRLNSLFFVPIIQKDLRSKPVQLIDPAFLNDTELKSFKNTIMSVKYIKLISELYKCEGNKFNISLIYLRFKSEQFDYYTLLPFLRFSFTDAILVKPLLRASQMTELLICKSVADYSRPSGPNKTAIKELKQCMGYSAGINRRAQEFISKSDYFLQNENISNWKLPITHMAIPANNTFMCILTLLNSLGDTFGAQRRIQSISAMIIEPIDNDVFKTALIRNRALPKKIIPSVFLDKPAEIYFKDLSDTVKFFKNYSKKWTAAIVRPNPSLVFGSSNGPWIREHMSTNGIGWREGHGGGLGNATAPDSDDLIIGRWITINSDGSRTVSEAVEGIANRLIADRDNDVATPAIDLEAF